MHSNNCFFISNARCGVMQQSDVNKRCVVYDRPIGEGNGILGTIIEVSSDGNNFKLRTDSSKKYPNGNTYEFSTGGDNPVKIKYLEESL